MTEIFDLRGRERVPTRAPVLSDPSGRRARLLARAGRAAAAMLTLWIAGLALAGLGILPAGDVPLGHALAGAAPPALRHLPAARAVSAADLRPAVPVEAALSATRPAAGTYGPSLPAAGRGHPIAHPKHGAHRGGGRSRGSGHTGNPATGGAPGGAGAGTAPTPGQGTTTAPGTPSAVGTTTPRPSTAPGQSTKQTAPSHTATTSPGNSAAAPGQANRTTTTTTSSTPGQSGSAPGQTVTHGSGGHGHNG